MGAEKDVKETYGGLVKLGRIPVILSLEGKICLTKAKTATGSESTDKHQSHS